MCRELHGCRIGFGERRSSFFQLDEVGGSLKDLFTSGSSFSASDDLCAPTILSQKYALLESIRHYDIFPTTLVYCFNCIRIGRCYVKKASLCR